MFEDSVAPTLEAAASAMSADVQSVQVAGDSGSQRSTRGAGALQKEEEEVVKLRLV